LENGGELVSRWQVIFSPKKHTESKVVYLGCVPIAIERSYQRMALITQKIPGRMYYEIVTKQT
jgi:hypothetical protein